MRPKLIRNTNLQWAIIAGLAFVVLISIFPPEFTITRIGAKYAIHTMFTCLFMGLLFLTLRQKRLMFASFIACSFLCVFLKNATNNSFSLPEKTIEEVFDISQYNASSFTGNVNVNLNSILESDADVISIQELTPDWGSLLKSNLKKEYPYQTIVYRMEDFLGLGIFSKLPFTDIDTIYHGDIPNLAVKINNGADEITILSSYIYPEISSTDIKKVKSRFNALKNCISQINTPFITCGDFNQVQWSSHLQDLKKNLDLDDSRRFQFFNNPTDHIFFSRHFNCIDFQTINNRFTNHLGIKGSYQINRNQVDAQKTAKKF